jgi:regulation of enolase protein 1 (concanavalin A-like superfamily)
MRTWILDWVGVCLAVLTVLAIPSRSIAQTLPSPWLTRDIGSPSPAGSATYSNQQFTIKGSGNDIWSSSDQFRFVYQPISGDVEIVARIGSFTAVDPWSKVGVMIRNDLTSGSAYAFSLLSGANGIAFQRRTTAGGSSYTTAGPLVSTPRWVRLRRVGSTLTASTGTDGGSWQTVGSATISMNSTIYAGLAITSHNPGSLASAVVTNASVTPLGTMPAAMSTRDIGSPSITGSMTYSAGVYTIKGAGVDIWGTSDQFRFVYQQITGDVDIVARLKSIQDSNAWAKAGVMIRESLNANARNAMAVLSAGKGYSFQWRLDTGGLSDYTRTNTGAAPGWIRLKRTGYQIQAYRSADGASWTSIGVQTVPMADTVYVGLAVTSHNSSQLTTAVMDQMKVTASSPAVNQPPSITLTSPSASSSFLPGTSISLAANASDPEGRLSRVEFYVGSTRVASDTTAPYSATWATSVLGSYIVKAIAYDADGGVTTSSSNTISIASSSSSSTVPTKVVFQASADHATLVTSYRLDVFANGANPSSATPVATSNLGKPTPASNGDITVDRATFFSALARGTYVATVSAIGSGGSSRSASITFTR